MIVSVWSLFSPDAPMFKSRETKSTHERDKRRRSENAKIEAAIEHFKAIGIGYEVTIPPPPTWNP